VAYLHKIMLRGAMKLVQFADILAKMAFPVPMIIFQLEDMKMQLAEMQIQESKKEVKNGVV